MMRRYWSQSTLTSIVSQARTQPLRPNRTPPVWLDEAQLLSGQAFLAKHNTMIQQVLSGSSLAATFAARDVTPILMQTGKLPKSFLPRMMETGILMAGIEAKFASRDEFVRKNYVRAVSLGELHVSVAAITKPALGWDPKQRVPMSQQAYAFVLYTFAWWPIEALLALRKIDPMSDRKEIDAWFHFWSVAGYGMGVLEELLPKNYAEARERVALLRQAQYFSATEPPTDGIPTLLGGQVKMLAAMRPDRLRAARQLAELIALSPGLMEALGLGKDPVTQLLAYESSIAR
jgi:hypothetical protein